MKIYAKETKHLHLLCLIAVALSVALMAVQAVMELLPYNPSAVHDGQLACTYGGAYFAVAPDGRLVAWGENNPSPHISYDGEFPRTPFFARRTMMRNVSEVYATGRAVFALDRGGTLWRWNDLHGTGGYFSLRLPFTDAPEKLLENVVCFDRKAGSENEFTAVTADGGLYLCGKYDEAVPIGTESSLSGPWDLSCLTEHARGVYIFGNYGFVIDDEYDLWAWCAPGSNLMELEYEPVRIAEYIRELSMPREDCLLALTGTGDVYTYDLEKVRETQTHSADNFSPEPIASGVRCLYDGGWLNSDGSVGTVQQVGSGEFSAQRGEPGALYTVTAMGPAAWDDYRHTRLTVTADGRLVWDGGSVPLGGLSPKWRDASLCFFLAALLLRWAERKRAARAARP